MIRVRVHGTDLPAVYKLYNSHEIEHYLRFTNEREISVVDEVFFEEVSFFFVVFLRVIEFKLFGDDNNCKLNDLQ